MPIVLLALGFLGGLSLGTRRYVDLSARHLALCFIGRRLLETLPRCDRCTSPATHAFRRGEGRWCATDAPAGCPPYPRAYWVEAMQRALKEEHRVSP